MTNPLPLVSFEQAELGPKMQACTERERRFVWHYLALGGQAGCGAEAARLAGYSDHMEHAKVRAHLVLQRDRVLEALDEVGRKAFRGLLMPAVQAAMNMIDNPKHKGHTTVVLSTLSRLGLVERTGVDVNVTGEVTVSHTEEAVLQLKAMLQLGVPREKLIELFGFSGLQRYEDLLREREGRMKDVSRETKVIEHKGKEGE